MTNKLYEEGKKLIDEIYELKLKIFNFLSVSTKTTQQMEEIENGIFALVSTERHDTTGKYVYPNAEARKAETKNRLLIHEKYTELLHKTYELKDEIRVLKAELKRKEQLLTLLNTFGDKCDT